MTTGQVMILDHAVALLGVAAWFATGTVAATRRAGLALGVLAAAVLVTLGRVATVATLAGRGWWYAQEKVLLGLPMLGVAGMAAVLIAGPRLLSASRAPTDGPSAISIVSLLSTGYAALAGLLVTFVAGYPLTWSTALIAGSLVIVAALLTWHVVTRSVGATTHDGVIIAAGHTSGAALPSPGASQLSRRKFIGLTGGAVAAGTGATGVGLLFAPAESVATGGGSGGTNATSRAVSVVDLRGASTPAPGRVRRRYELTARKADVMLASGHEIEAWTYDGRVPGPPITATQGDLIEVTLRNADIDGGVTLHWHGYDVPCGEDGAPGVTQHAVQPGERFDYRFRADQVGTYWYHTHQASHIGVRRGLFGTLVVTPHPDDAAAEGLDLTLPVHTFDGKVVFGGHDEVAEYAAPVGNGVRLRLINTDSVPHRFALAGTPLRVAAVDGRDLNEPDEISETALSLPAGGRYDLVFVMPDAPVALVVDNDHTSGLRLRPDDAGTADDNALVADTSGWPELDLLRYGTPAPVPFDRSSDFDRHFTLVLDRGVAMVDGRPAYAHTVNGRGHPSIPDQLVTEGDLVRVTVVNRSMETHPWHLHGQPVLILSRDGTRSSGSPLWVDTFDVRPGQVWEVAFEATNPGIWMNHCHNLPHAHQGMMLRLRYDGVTTPFDGSGTLNGANRTSHGH